MNEYIHTSISIIYTCMMTTGN